MEPLYQSEGGLPKQAYLSNPEKYRMHRFKIFTGKRSWMVPFFTIWTGQAFSLLGSQLVQFALIWYLTKKTGSATVLATASLVGLLPQVVLLRPVAGAMVDRWSRRAVMILSDGTVALATLAGLPFPERQGRNLAYLPGHAGARYGRQLPLASHAGFDQPDGTERKSVARAGRQPDPDGRDEYRLGPAGALLLEFLPVHGVLAIDIGTALLAILPLVLSPSRSR
jgi:MFS transporter, DHA3 family, macrolide efflux protein